MSRGQHASKPIVLTVALFLLLFVSVESQQLFVNVGAAALAWDATFESGVLRGPSGYNTSPVTTNGASAGVSTSRPHTGNWSEYDYYVGAAPATVTRAQTHEDLVVLKQTSPSFHVDIWVYVPSTVQGKSVQLTDWQSLASFGLTTGGTFFTVDSSPSHHLTVWDVATRKSYSTTGVWNFDTWFKLGVTAYLKPAPGNSEVIIFLNEKTIADDFISGAWAESLGYMHFGLYTGPKQGTYAVYNDDISYTPLTNPVQSTAAPASSSGTTPVASTTATTSSLTYPSKVT